MSRRRSSNDYVETSSAADLHAARHPDATRPACWQSTDEAASLSEAVLKLPHTVSFGHPESTVSFAETPLVKHNASLSPKFPYQEHRSSSSRSRTEDEHSNQASQIDQGPASVSGSSLTEETDATSASSAQRASREAGLTILRICGVKIAIPFTAWTFLAMAVPIIFLVAVVARPLASATDVLHEIDRLAPMAEFASDCLSALSQERLNSVLYLRGVGGFETVSSWRAVTDQSCGVDWMRFVQHLAAEDEYFATSFQQAVLHGNSLAAMRQRVDDFHTDTVTYRDVASDLEISSFLEEMIPMYDAASKAASEAVALCADKIEVADARFFLSYKLIADLRLAAYAFVGEACSLAGLESNDAAKVAQHGRFVASYDALNAARGITRALARGFVRQDLVGWWTSEAMLALREAVEPSLRGASLLVNATVILEMGTDAITLLESMENTQIERLSEAVTLKATVTENSLLAAFSIGVCLAAAGLLAWQQLRVQAQLETQVANVERTRRAVSAFVPRFFLAKMGYTSITQVRVGESTNVALAMLFADVRRFTTVSEGMSCDALFNWVQEYFRRMTLVVDSRNGNINQFIGDGLFAVFSSARDSVRCAIDMQSDVQQLNVQRLCEQGNNVPIEIGVGLHHDVLAMGILGDERRHTCTAISASVNLASRLDGLTKQLGCRILSSQAVIDQLAPLDLESVQHRRVGAVRVKGSALNTVVYDIFQADERAVQQYKRETKAAFEAFATLSLLSEDAAVVAAAANKLREVATASEVVDRAIDEMLRCRDVATVAFVFDLK
jgi:class 3 adenylate cyclase